MPYSADISRANPACFLFLIDQSHSMTLPLAGVTGRGEMDGAADVINRTLETLSQRCSQGMDFRGYFHIGVIGYNTDRNGSSIITAISPGATRKSSFRLPLAYACYPAPLNTLQAKGTTSATVASARRRRDARPPG